MIHEIGRHCKNHADTDTETWYNGLRQDIKEHGYYVLLTCVQYKYLKHLNKECVNHLLISNCF